MLKPKRKISRRELKEDKFVLTVLKAREWFETHSRKVFYGIVALLAVFLLVSFYSQSRKKAEEAASYMLSQAQLALAKGDENTAIARLNDLTDRYEGTSSAGYATFLLGKIYWQKNDTLKAEEYFKKYIEDYSGDRFITPAALAGYADCLVLKGQYEEAAQQYQRAAEINPEFPMAPVYLFSAAMAYSDAGKIDRALPLLKKIVEDYESSPYRDRAELLLAQLELKKTMTS